MQGLTPTGSASTHALPTDLLALVGAATTGIDTPFNPSDMDPAQSAAETAYSNTFDPNNTCLQASETAYSNTFDPDKCCLQISASEVSFTIWEHGCRAPSASETAISGFSQCTSPVTEASEMAFTLYQNGSAGCIG